MRQIHVHEQRSHLRHVPRQQQVVVGEVADDLAARLAERLVTVELAMPRPFRQVEEANALVLGEGLERCSRVVLDAVPDHEDFDRGVLLVECAAHRMGKQRGVPEGRDQDRGVDHVARARARSSAIAATMAAPSTALERGGGPPRRCSTKARSSASRGSSPGV